ncbi:hypothetical protein QTP88_023862 [Uroleucon formosanum]
MNIIKLSALMDHVIVNETDKKNIKGINAITIKTLDSIVIPIQIKDETFITKFDIVKDDFPIPGSGIIGRTFLKENKAILDMNQEMLLIPEREYGEHLSATDVVTHKINTPRCAKPINIRPYRLPWAYQQEIEKQITDMKQNNIIRNSTSFNFPLVVVKKKGADPDGKQKLRICVDFRKLNEITENEAYSLPNLLEILESLGSSKYFSTLDLKSGYHQVKIDESIIMN